jgi:hypothetical protein
MTNGRDNEADLSEELQGAHTYTTTIPSIGNSAPQDVVVASTGRGRAELSLGAGVTPILPLQDQQGARRPHSAATAPRTTLTQPRQPPKPEEPGRRLAAAARRAHRDLRHGGHSPDQAYLLRHHQRSSMPGTMHATPPPTTKAATKRQTRRPQPPPQPGHTPPLRTPQIYRKRPTTTSLTQIRR